MITLIEKDEGACALCTSPKPKPGYLTRSERMGEAFLCRKHVDKLMDIEEGKVEQARPLFNRLPDPPEEININGGRTASMI